MLSILFFPGSENVRIEGKVIMSQQFPDLGNVQINQDTENHIQLIMSLSQDLSTVSLKCYETLNSEEQNDDSIALLHVLAIAIQKSFNNGFGRGYLEALFNFMNNRRTVFCQAHRETELDGFLLNVEYKKVLKNKKTLVPGVQTRSSQSSSDDVSSGKSNFLGYTSAKKSEKKHHTKDLQIPDFVVLKRPRPKCPFAMCSVVFEIKNNFSGTSIHEGIAQLLSYSFAKRIKQKSYEEMAMLLITPRCWLVGKLPPYGEEIAEQLVFTALTVFDTDKQGVKECLVKENYIWIIKFLSKYIY